MIASRLDAGNWILSRGLTPEWRQVVDRRAGEGLAKLRRIYGVYRRQAPAAAKRRGYDSGLRYFLERGSQARIRLATDPCFDYWLHLWDRHFSNASPVENWHLQFGLFQGFAARLALARGESREFGATLDPDAHLHLYGGTARIEFPPDCALKPVRIATGPRGLMAAAGSVSGAWPRAAALSPGPAVSAGGAVLRHGRAAAPGLEVGQCGLLLTQAVVMHGLARLSAREEGDFASVLDVALRHIRERDAGLHAEMTDMVRVLVPLTNPRDHGSVSSSYVDMRGAICLSHAADPLLQAETLIHEFCHQKINQLTTVDPILLPGQDGQVFYSPWRKDARRLRGLILGAHAFLNVAAYLLKSLSREDYPLRPRISLMCNIARRLFEVEAALGSACGYGSFTEFGQRFILGMTRELSVLFHGVQWFPPELLRETRAACHAHRRRYALALTGIHKAEGFSDGIRRLRYGQRRVIVRGKARAAAGPAKAGT